MVKKSFKGRRKPPWERKAYSHDPKVAVKQYRSDVNKYLFGSK